MSDMFGFRTLNIYPHKMEECYEKYFSKGKFKSKKGYKLGHSQDSFYIYINGWNEIPKHTMKGLIYNFACRNDVKEARTPGFSERIIRIFMFDSYYEIKIDDRF